LVATASILLLVLLGAIGYAAIPSRSPGAFRGQGNRFLSDPKVPPQMARQHVDLEQRAADVAQVRAPVGHERDRREQVRARGAISGL